MDLEIYYDDKKVNYGPDLQDPTKQSLPAPREGQRVMFVVKNKSEHKVGMVLRVNGISTIMKEEGREVRQYTRWVLLPGKTYKIRGFYNADGTVQVFKALSEEQSQQIELNPRARGLLELDVFCEGKEETEKKKKPITLRTPEALVRDDPPATLGELKTRLRKALGENVVQNKGLVVPGESTGLGVGTPPEKTEVTETEMRNPVHASSMTIRLKAPK